MEWEKTLANYLSNEGEHPKYLGILWQSTGLELELSEPWPRLNPWSGKKQNS